MGKLRHASILGLALIAAGFTVFFIKAAILDYPLVADKSETVWNFEIYLEFDGRNEPAVITSQIPASDVQRIFPEEQFYNGSFGLSLDTDADSRNRVAIWTYRYPGNRKVLRYAAQTLGETTRTPLPLSFRESTPEEVPFEADQIKRQAFIVWTGNLRQRSADDRSFANLAIQAAFDDASAGELYADELAVLLAGHPGEHGRLDLARDAMRSQGIPARVANGVYLSDERRRVEIKSWLEYYVGGRDYRFFPDNEDPTRFLTIWYGEGVLAEATGVDNLDVQVTVAPARRSAKEIAEGGASRFSSVGKAFSLDDLPLTTQLVYRVLLTIPIGITILVFLRQFVGVKTLGTFMPVLIGIAFRETALINGILLFSVLVAAGLSLRFYLERLQLLLVPRLAVVLIFIVMVMAGITVLLTETNQAIGLSISLFPMVILTMTIERMSILWEETSASEAIKAGLGSLAIASITFLAMSNPRAEHLMYQFPELLFVLMGLCVLMGRYTGLRLSELWRFKALAK